MYSFIPINYIIGAEFKRHMIYSYHQYNVTESGYLCYVRQNNMAFVTEESKEVKCSDTNIAYNREVE